MRTIEAARVILFIVFLSQFPVSILAVNVMNANGSDATIEEQWVNWYPGYRPCDADVLQLSDDICAHVPYEEIPTAIHNWVCDNIYYDWDAFREQTYGALRADEVLRERRSVCEGISNLTQELLIAADVPCIKVWGLAIPTGSEWGEMGERPIRVNHTWNEYYMDGSWHYLDCTMDMHNRYENGMYLPEKKGYANLDPRGEVFCQTHRTIYRGEDLPENIPSEWAKTELEQAVNQRLFPLCAYSKYNAPICISDFYAMLGESAEGDETVTRAQAAIIIAGRLPKDKQNDPPFSDLSGCDPEQVHAIAILYYNGIVLGTGNGAFRPNSELTRQEAMLLLFRIAQKENG